MLNSYFDLAMSPPNIQKAAAAPFARQQKERLAVLPAADLSDAAKTGMASRQAGQRLALDERRLALDAEKQAYNQGQLPWTTAFGALGAAAQLYGGYRALEDAQEMRQLYAGTQAIRDRWLTEAQGSHDRWRAEVDQTTGALGRIPNYTYDRPMRPTRTMLAPVGAPAGYTPGPVVHGPDEAQRTWALARAMAHQHLLPEKDFYRGITP